MKQKAIIVSSRLGDDNLNTYDLNTYLADGWTVFMTCPMPSSLTESSNNVTTAFVPTCLVIIQK